MASRRAGGHIGQIYKDHRGENTQRPYTISFKQIPVMKRNANIAPLSRDHHHSLLFCWKIRQGIAKGVGLERIQPYILYFYKMHLEKHFQEEEALLFRVIDDPLCLCALDEHRRVLDLVKAITGSKAWDAEYYSGLADL